jgi:hypothetical protein
MQIVGRVKGAESTPPTTAAAALLAAAEAAGGGVSGASTTDAAAATAALLAFPRHGLRTPRARLSEQQVELAMVEAGEILGENTACTCKAGSAVCVLGSWHEDSYPLVLSQLGKYSKNTWSSSMITSLLVAGHVSTWVGWSLGAVCVQH